jgi:hypothetical protein
MKCSSASASLPGGLDRSFGRIVIVNMRAFLHARGVRAWRPGSR